ncbi:ferrisiderophore receptor [Methylorubrum extorquens]|uniref:TonB-dependent siderophore receptor n=1 Tax=Methylorubrum extorquens TaxID=408 RepID=UPI00116AE67A|nr:TonB-dependent siderophore receptor [Methylorubrum extorquens]GEL42752.1 ferrisiderophore receptor [Methylorubrum extorquens]
MSSALRDRLRYGFAAFLAGTAALGSSGAAWAQEAVTLETLSVEGSGRGGSGPGGAGTESAFGPVPSYVAQRSATGTKTDTALKETPQSISVVGEQQVREQAATSVQEALRYTAGVAAEAYGPSTRGDYPRIRGSDAAIFLDGLRLKDPDVFNEPRPDPYTLSRFEVLRGPASTLYGSSPVGGLINLVSKRPLDVPYTEAGVRFGNYGWKEAFTDSTGRLTEDGQFLYRFVGIGRLADAQTDFVANDRYVINPSVTWRPSADTTWTLIGLHQKDAFGASDAFLPREGSLYAGPNGFIPLNRFTGDPNFNRYETETSSITSLFEHRFDDSLILRQNLRYSHIDGTYQSAYGNVYTLTPSADLPNAPFLDPARRTVDRFTYRVSSIKDRITTDTNLQGRFATGPVSHTVLGGVDFRQQWDSTRTGFGTDARPFDLYAPVYVGVTPPDLGVPTALSQSQTGLYLQDQIKFGQWIVLATMRHDWVNSATRGAESVAGEATTGRIGLMYAFENGLTPYVSYATSFTPIFGANVCAGGACRPIEGEQIEGGFKYNPTPWFAVNAAIYDTVERNRLTPDPSGLPISIQTGKVKIQGGDIEAIATINNDTNIIASYAYTDARYAAGDNAGARVETQPLHLASLWVTHRFTLAEVPGSFLVGGGVRHIGESFDGSLNSFNTPAVTLADALVGWEDAHWRAQLNVSNIADTRYLSTCLARGDCFVGTRRTILGSLTYKF